jgi:hypothetical protein
MFLLSYCFIFRTDYSDSETIEEDYMAEIAEMQEQDLRRSSLEEPAGKPVKEKEKRKVYRRSHSLVRFIGGGNQCTRRKPTSCRKSYLSVRKIK